MSESISRMDGLACNTYSCKGLARDFGILLFLLLGCLALWFAAWHPWWHGHIVVDPFVYWTRSTSFFAHGLSWGHLGYNEYQPGALWFFAAVGLLSGLNVGFEHFLSTLMLVNLVIFALHVLLARLAVSRAAAVVMIILGVLVGPILLCRFELLVSLMVIGSWLLWSRGHVGGSAVLLGVATATKLYPLLLLPLLLWAAWSHGDKLLGAVKVVLYWAIGGFFVVGWLGLFGCYWVDILDSVKFHLDKPFGVDGLLGSLVPVTQYLLDIPLQMAPRNGIHGFEQGMGVLIGLALSWLWVPVVLFITLTITTSTSQQSSPLGVFLLLAWYVLLGKLTAPQYAWWALPFFALSFRGGILDLRLRAPLVAVCCALLISQLIYPVYYSEFLACFSGNYGGNKFFWVNTVKNLLWLAALVVATRIWFTQSRFFR